MVITINGSAINLDLDTILIWCLVGLVAGFVASRVALGHGLGLFGDIIVGIIGAFIGGVLANRFPTKGHGVSHPRLKEDAEGVSGAAVPPLEVRPFSGGGGGRPCSTATEPRPAE